MPEANVVAAALAKAQAEFQPIHRDRTVTVRMKSGGQYTFSYAPLESILRATMPALNKQGLALTQRIGTEGNGELVITSLLHEAGEISNSVRVICKEEGAQAYGSALTYARRYGVTLLLGICADDDDDANAAEGNESTVTRDAAADIPPETRKAAKQYADKFVEAFNLGMEDAVYDLHLECNQDPALYSLVSTYIPTPTRREMRTIIERCREARRPNGRA